MAFEERRILEIDGGLVVCKRVIRESEVSLDDYLKAAVNSAPFDSGPLPQGGAYLRNIDQANPGRVLQLFSIERPPGPFCLQYRVVKRGQTGAAAKDEENMTSLCLSWPRVLWNYRFAGKIQTTHRKTTSLTARPCVKLDDVMPSGKSGPHRADVQVVTHDGSNHSFPFTGNASNSHVGANTELSENNKQIA